MARTVFEKSGQLQDLTVQVVLSLEQISRNIDNLLWKQALEHELSPLQIRILLFIRFHKEQSGVSLLATEFNLSKATISVALKPMEQKKLVIKRKSESDGRNINIVLTDWGNQIAHVAGFYLEPLRKIIAHIPEQEKEIMLKNLTGILGKMTPE